MAGPPPMKDHFPPWIELGESSLTLVREKLNFEVAPEFPLQIRQLIDLDIAGMANIVFEYLDHWDSEAHPETTAGSDDLMSLLHDFRAKMPQLMMFVKLAANQSGRDDDQLRTREYSSLCEWTDSWLRHLPEDSTSGRLLYSYLAETSCNWLGTRQELQEAITVWEAARIDERHVAVLLTRIAFAKEFVLLACRVLVEVDHIPQDNVLDSMEDLFRQVQDLLEHCNVPDLPEESDSDASLVLPPAPGISYR